MKYSFLEWLLVKEAVQTHLGYMPGEDEEGSQQYKTAGGLESIPPRFTQPKLGPKDSVGIPTLAEPDLRAADKKMILQTHPQLEEKLKDITKKLGLHFIVSYLPPEAGTPQVNNQPSVRMSKKLGAKGWEQYKAYSHKEGEQQLMNFIQNNSDASPQNTIVYMKNTSRVDTLGPWQQQHNIGHAIWGYAKREGSHLKSIFVKTMRDIMYEMHQKHYQATPEREPTAQEMTILLCRLFNIESCRKIFQSMPPSTDPRVKDNRALTNPKWKVHSMFNSFDELMFELLGVYIHNHGTFLPNPDLSANRQRPVEPYNVPGAGEKPPRVAGQEEEMWRSAGTRKKMEPNAEILRWTKEKQAGRAGTGKGAADIRPYVWEEIPVGAEEWHKAFALLDGIVAEAFKACTWDKVGGPIYATSGYVTTGA